MDIKKHWQAIYNAARAGLDAAGFQDLPILHVDSENGVNSEEAVPPFVTYRDETELTVGTVGRGSLKVLRSGWLFTFRDEDLSGALDASSAVINALVDSKIVTGDGYTTTDLDLLGQFTIWEPDLEVYARYVRFVWERSL